MPNERSSPVDLQSRFLADADPSDRHTFAIATLRIAVGLFFAIFGQYTVFGTDLPPTCIPGKVTTVPCRLLSGNAGLSGKS